MMKQESMYRLGYRSDIEGLRAVAILLVVGAHARLAPFAGGFVGVDVFFVLSGYLITGLLMREVEQRGEVAFAEFYARRLRRLLPGLLLMLACTAILGYLLTAPGEQPEQANAVASAALWLSNFFFAFEGLEYFSPGSDANLVLHTWSLGVEEQFYIVWPLLLVFATNAWGGARKPPNLQRVKIVMPIILVISLAMCVAWSYEEPALAFYMMPARAWQFALGALVFAYCGSPAAVDESKIGQSRKTFRAPVWLGWSGLAAIIAAGALLSPQVTYPWPWALVPSLGAAAILAAGARVPTLGVGALLSRRPFQVIGRISYSWYLWHWPILLIGANLIDVQNLAPRLALVAASGAVAAVAYRYFETPIRRYRAVVRFPRMAVAGAFVVMVLAGVAGSRWSDNALDRMRQPEQLRYVRLRLDGPAIYAMHCDDWYQSADVHPCAFGPPDASHTAVIIGDSVALQWFPAVAKIFRGPDWRLIALTKSACPMVDAPVFYDRIHRIYTECAQWRDAALRHVASVRPDIVLLGSTYGYDLSPEQWTDGTGRVLKQISAASGHIYILRSTPRLPFDATTCLAPRSQLYQALASNSSCTATAHTPQGDAVYGWLSTAAVTYPNVSLIDMTNAVCPHDVCSAERDGIIVFRDSQHLTTQFVASITHVLAHVLNLDAAAPSSDAAGAPANSASPVPQSTP